MDTPIADQLFDHGAPHDTQEEQGPHSNDACPTQAFVFIEESILTVDDGYFAVKAPGNLIWQNSPTVRHGGAGELSFADGHAEIWRWRYLNKDQNLDAPVRVGGLDTTPDLVRLQAAAAWRR